MIKHVVLLRFKQATPSHTVSKLEKAFAGLRSKVQGVIGLEWGRNASAEGLDKGFTHCFIVAFVNEASRDAYLPHPAHQEFVEQLKPWLEDVLVVDFVPENQ